MTNKANHGRSFALSAAAAAMILGCSSDTTQDGNVGGQAGAGGRTLGGAAGSTTSTGGSSTGGVAQAGVSGHGAVTPSAGTAGVSQAGGGAGGAAAGASAVNAGQAGVTSNGVPRPQLEDADAANYTIRKYLEKGGTVTYPVVDNWDPTAGVGDVAALTPDYVVSATSTLKTIQGAIDQATLDDPNGTARKTIRIAEGTYREFVRVPANAPPLTLYSTNPDASQTVIVYNRFSGTPYIPGEYIPGGGKCIKPSAAPSGTGGTSGVAGASGRAGTGTLDAAGAGGSAGATSAAGAVAVANAGAAGAPAASTWGTSAASTFGVCAAKLWVKNITISNDFDESTTTSSSVQAPAMTIQSDLAIFDNVRFLGNQDTVQVKSSDVGMIARSYFKNCYIEGDTDFIFGRGTAVFDNTTIRYVSQRKSGGSILAPSTDKANPYGFLVINSRLTVDVDTATDVAYLGRAWDESVAKGAWTSASIPNGQALIRNSTIDGFVKKATPWATSTSDRPFDSTINRLFEYQNQGAGAAP